MLTEAENDETVWPKYNEQLLQIAEAALKTLPSSAPEYRFYKKHYSSALNNLGVISRKKGNIPKAFECYNGKYICIYKYKKLNLHIR